MKALCGVIRALSSLGLVLGLLAAALIIAPPYVVRYALLDYLHEQGIDATIGHVEANLFTGDITIDDARGRVDGDTVFDIGHLSLRLRYPALLEHRVSLAHFDLADTAIDVRRGADNSIRIGGVDVLSAHPESQTTTGWGFALSQLHLGQLTIHYSQPAGAHQQAIDRQITLNKTKAADVRSWQPDDPIPMDADISYGDSHIRISGHITPFNPQLSAHIRLRTSDLSLDRLGPISASLGLDHLGGQLDSDQQIDITYSSARDLKLQIDGSMTWQHARLSGSGGLDVRSRRLQWQGKAKAELLKADNQPSSVDAQGTLKLANLRANQSGQFSFRQADGGWQGSAHATLAGEATTINTQGRLTTRQTRLSAPGRLQLSADQSTLNGNLNTRLSKNNTSIQTDGSFLAQGMSFAIPESMNFDSDTLNWHGKTTTRLGDSTTRINTDGRMNIDALGFRIPGTSAFTSRSASWQGSTNIHSAALFARQAQGTLALDDARLEIEGAPLTITANRLAYQGRYAEQPDADNDALRLTLHGDINSHQFDVENTAIGAPWVSVLQLHAARLSIDGLNRIRLPGLDTRGIRILGDTDTSSAVLQAVSLEAQSFALDDLAHYSADSVDIKHAIIHTRRTLRGYGVISEFLGRTKHPKQGSDGASAPDNSGSHSTYAIRHFSLSGPAAAFVDTVVTPRVDLNGSDINLTVDDLDTSNPEHRAQYRLSLDVGAYGHLDSTGKIAPMASKGINMELKAWLRSLAMAPLSGYLDAAMGRKIANGAADGTLHLTATDGQLDGDLDTTLSNFRLANKGQKKTNIAYGISLDGALSLVRGRNDLIHFKTRILGDVTNPYFSIKNLVREAILAGLRTTLLSDYSPLGLLNRAKNAFLNLFRSVSDRPALFQPGYYYIRPDDRKYLSLIAQYMYKHPKVSLTVQGHANPDDRNALITSQGAQLDSRTHLSLQALARQRGEAVRDYLAARNVNPDRVKLQDPIVDDSADARPRATFTLDKP